MTASTSQGVGGSRLFVWSCAIVTAAFLAALVVWPLASVLDRSLEGVGSERVTEVLRRDSFRRVLWFTFWQAAVSAGLTMIVGLPIARVLARYRFLGRGTIRAAAVVPFVLPTVVVAAAMQATFDRLRIDLDRSLAAILAAHVFFNVAVVIRVVGGFWATLDDRPVQAARVLGASPWRAFRSITLPRLTPVMLGAGLLVFLFSFTSFGVILVLGGPRRATIETEIYRYAIFRQEFDVSAILALIQIAVVAGLSMLAARFQRRFARADRGRALPSARPVRSVSDRLQVGAAILLVMVVVGLPIASLVEASLDVGDGHGLANYRRLADPVSLLPVSPVNAVATSLRFAAVAAALATAVGVMAAIAVVRAGRVGRVLETAALIPLGVSAVTLGFGYLLAFAALDLRRSPWLIPMAHAVVGVPFVLAAVVPALRSIDPRIRQAAATLGASPMVVLRVVDWPLVKRAAATGAGFAFAISLGEFGATSFLSRADTAFTAPLAIFRLLSQPGTQLRGQALALSVVMGAIVAVVAAVVERRRDAGPVLM